MVGGLRCRFVGLFRKRSVWCDVDGTRQRESASEHRTTLHDSPQAHTEQLRRRPIMREPEVVNIYIPPPSVSRAHPTTRERPRDSPEPAHVDLLVPRVLRVERLEVVLHDETEVANSRDLLPRNIALGNTGTNTEEGYSVREPIRDAHVGVLFADPWLRRRLRKHARAQTLRPRASEGHA